MFWKMIEAMWEIYFSLDFRRFSSEFQSDEHFFIFQKHFYCDLPLSRNLHSSM